MKKLKLFLAAFVILFLTSCYQSRDVKQYVNYDNKYDRYSVTTSFSYPHPYSSYVYCLEAGIDSAKIAEMLKAEQTQEEMIRIDNLSN